MQHSINRLTMDLPNVSKTIWFTTTSCPPLWDSKNSSKLSMHDTGNKKEKSPMKPTLLDLLETSPNRSLTLTSPTTSPARFFSVKEEQQQLWLYQGKGSTSKQKKSTTPKLSSKLGKYRKLTPQQFQHHLDNKLCLFCC